MKKFIGVFLAIILIISQSTLVFADKNGANLNLKCKSAVLMDVTSGKVLYEKNCHEKLPPASVTKVMTMLLICEAVESNKIKLTDGTEIEIADLNLVKADLANNKTFTVTGVDISTSNNASGAITTIDNAINSVSKTRSQLGAVQNRLEHTTANLDNTAENLTSAESRVRDVDMAKEMMTFSSKNILQQAAQSMIAQANKQPQNVLSLLR